MKKTRFAETQIIGILKESDAGTPVKEICRQRNFFQRTPVTLFYNYPLDRKAFDSIVDFH